jgi:hypothetical protein
LAVNGNLVLGGTNNIFAGPGFTNGVYTVMTYTGTLSGSPPVLGTTPPGFIYAFDTGTAGQVKLIVALPSLVAPTNLIAVASNLLVNLKWNAVNGATTYNVKRGTTSGVYPVTVSGIGSTNYADGNVSNAVTYFYVVSATGMGAQGSNSVQVSAVPLPSNQPTNIVMQTGGGQMQLSWPQSHQGWRLQIQTNDLAAGIGTNWVTVPGSTNANQANINIGPTNGSVFLRLIYP